MQRYTLDTNCVFALEEERAEAVFIRRLLARCASGLATTQIAAIAAAERRRCGEPIENFSEFQRRLDQLGFGAATILTPPAYVGIAFVDYCRIHSDEAEELERKIHDILFSSVPFEFVGGEMGTAAWKRWLNAKCDVLTMWCHLHYGGEVFVTADENFHRASKKPRLVGLGAGQIVRPSEL
ncbi:MAG: hypothetical protein NVV63_02450 [Opitutus sp.]|nr:hypothetical protein [Opitutus sp.]